MVALGLPWGICLSLHSPGADLSFCSLFRGRQIRKGAWATRFCHTRANNVLISWTMEPLELVVFVPSYSPWMVEFPRVSPLFFSGSRASFCKCAHLLSLSKPCCQSLVVIGGTRMKLVQHLGRLHIGLYAEANAAACHSSMSYRWRFLSGL